MAEVSLTVNGQRQTVDVELDTPLLYVLRNDLELNGAKFGCGLAQCGACIVVVNGNAMPSCTTPVSAVADGEITTLEGIGTIDDPHPLQQAFIEEQAAQCGYCVAGIVMSAYALLQHNPDPSDTEIREALSSNFCRCGAQPRIVRAIKRAAGQEVA